MSLEIQIVSDLHLEFWANKTKFNFVKPSAPILALLGDTCCMGASDDWNIFCRFIDEILPLYEHIIIVLGNHEYYTNLSSRNAQKTSEHTMQAIDAKIKKFCKEKSPKLHLLNNSTLKFVIGKKKYVVIGSTLWSNIPVDQQARIQTAMSDYQYIYVQDAKTKKIRNVTPAEITALHLMNVKYIKRQIAKAKKEKNRVILLVHHRPYIDKSYDASGHDPAYHSDLNALIAAPLTFVGFGHTHVSTDMTLNNVRVYSNPKGYPSQRTGYDKAAKVTIKN